MCVYACVYACCCCCLICLICQRCCQADQDTTKQPALSPGEYRTGRTDKGTNRPTALAPLLTDNRGQQQQRSLSNLPVPFPVPSAQSGTLNRRPCGQQVAVAKRICIKIHLNKPSKEVEHETARRGVRRS